ncbi:MAG: type II toxin-antitoxin system RelE/ParE family toxin [Chitinophagales bacterium]|nr:type II toxin-antitoxin system RelE/ParE family toxin [Chitinophagales bacterium]
MARYKLTNEAVEDLTKIWNYTYEEWSEKQADKYYGMLIENCRHIADNSAMGRNYDGIRKDLFGLKSGKHIIFYRILNEGYIEITRILHERMDLKRKLSE